MNPKVLVGCPTYDGKGYCLKEYVEAVRAIDYDNFDFIMVDNSDCFNILFKAIAFAVIRVC